MGTKHPKPSHHQDPKHENDPTPSHHKDDLGSTTFTKFIFGTKSSMPKPEFIKLVSQKLGGTEHDVNLIVEKAGLESAGLINIIYCEKLFDGWFSPINIPVSSQTDNSTSVPYKNTDMVKISYKNTDMAMISYKNESSVLPSNSIPYIASLLNKPWFIAFSDGVVAERQLSSTEPGTFIIRFSSSTKGAYALSMKENTGQIGHWKISKEDDKFVIEGNYFNTLDQLIEKFSKVPLVNTSTLLRLPNDTPQNQSNSLQPPNITPQNQSNVPDIPPYIPNKLHTLNGWVSKTNYKSLLVKDENIDYHKEALDYVMLFLNSMQNFDQFIIQKCYLIHNESLLASHQNYFKSLKERWRLSHSLFYSNSWTKKDGDGRRQQFISNIEQYGSRFDWNTDKITVQSTPVIVPMIQGTSPEAAWKICSGGFATVATLDAGFYGKGIYFTSHTDYADNYSKYGYFVIALVIPGNVYPVTEEPEDVMNIPSGMLSQMTVEELQKKNSTSLYGKPCEQGYQSHYVCVCPKSSQNYGRPLETWTKDVNFGDELVVFQDAQALPICVVNLKPK